MQAYVAWLDSRFSFLYIGGKTQERGSCMKKNVWRGLCYLFAALILLGSTAGNVLEANRNVVDGFLGTKSYAVVSEGGGELYSTFTADYENTDALVAAHQAMGEQLMEEESISGVSFVSKSVTMSPLS